jgi:serine kinase of HPr protein (carbohydrate metabolism regulator)
MTELIGQASCVLVDGRALLIQGPSGSGKSSLALALIDRGATLVGDDGVRLEAEYGRLRAKPPPNIRGLIEIRNLGIATMPVGEGCVALSITLDPEAPRFVEKAQQVEIFGCMVPRIALWPDAPALPLRAEWALRLYGLA